LLSFPPEPGDPRWKCPTTPNSTAWGLAELVAKRAVTPLELVEAAIERIERHNPTLNAVVYKGYDDARAWAKSDLPDGPFRGVPFLIKDLGAQVKGWPRSSGSKFAQFPADAEDSELVRRYRQAGVVPVGKEQHAGIRHPRRHQFRTARGLPQPVEPRSHLGRLVRRGGVGDGGGDGAARPRQRRPGLDPDSGRPAAASSA
jgi:hypothetical protein